MKTALPNYVSTRNACRLCTPFGACLAFRGISGAIPFIHGSQGCATYIRRYLIGHFREPVDIACSNFSEQTAVFGGKDNLRIGFENVVRQYHPSLIGVATTCLSETIGDDMTMYLHEITKAWQGEPLPPVVPVSTASYRGSHADGYHKAVRAVVDTLAEPGPTGNHVNLLPAMISADDLRHLREILEDLGLEGMILPDYSDCLDGGTWDTYQLLPEGGTPLEAIRQSGSARASIELGMAFNADYAAGALLEARFDVPNHSLMLPVGVQSCDAFFDLLCELGQCHLPTQYVKQRGRLIDAYVDGHKYLFGKRAVVYGEADLVVAMAVFLSEIGMTPEICATGCTGNFLSSALAELLPDEFSKITVMEDCDFARIEEAALHAKPDMLIGNSHGAKTSRKLKVPLVRVGLPIHDRMGAARVRMLGYEGTLQLYDRIVNALIEQKQESSDIGYSHM